MKKIQIYQLNDSLEARDYHYVSLNFLKKYDMPIKLENYDLVYEYFDDNINEDINAALEDIFIKFQGEKPIGYTGVSVSVSDIIAIDGVKYYVESIGFEKLSI